EEALEEAVGQLRRESGTVVLHHHPGGAGEIVERDPHVAAARRELESVGKQIDEDALHLLQIAVDEALPRVAREGELDVIAPRERLDLIDEVLQVWRDVLLADLEAEPRFLELGEIEEVADHLEQLHAAQEHAIECSLLYGVVFLPASGVIRSAQV